MGRNAFANLARGASFSLFSVVLPLFLASYLAKDEYAVWVLALQIGSYVSLLDFGVQTAVVRFVAHASAGGSTERVPALLRTAVRWLAAMAVLGVVVVGVVAALLGTLFPKLPTSMLAGARLAILLIAVSLSFTLPVAVLASWFVGLQRNSVPALAIVVPRVVATAVVAALARQGVGIVALAAVIAASNFAANIALVALFRRAGGRLGPRSLRVPGLTRELVSFSWVLTVWTLSMLVIQGIDTLVVGRVEFSALGAYGFAGAVVTLLAGAMSNVFSVLVAPAARLTARGEATGLVDMVERATRFGSMALGVVGFSLFAGAGIVAGFLPLSYRSDAAMFLRVLVVAQAIRLCVVPFASVLVGAGDHRFAVIGAVAEAVANLVASVVFGVAFGAIGVAYGTLVGSIVGLFASVLLTMRLTTTFRIDRRRFVAHGLLRPLLVTSPLMVVGWLCIGRSPSVTVMALLVGLSLSGALILAFGLDGSERAQLRVRRSLTP